MRELSGEAIISLWESARGQHALDRAITLLAVAHRESTRDELASLPLGARDRVLLELSARLLGPRLELSARCPECAEGSEFEVTISDLLCPGVDADTVISTPRGPVRFRLPNSRDVASALTVGDATLARRALAARCIVDEVELDDELIEQLERAIETADPQAEVRFALTCASCSHSWKPLLDVGELLFAEVARVARGLLGEVHALADAYKWSEAAILGMSAARRRMYLEMVGYA